MSSYYFNVELGPIDARSEAEARRLAIDLLTHGAYGLVLDDVDED